MPITHLPCSGNWIILSFCHYRGCRYRLRYRRHLGTSRTSNLLFEYTISGYPSANLAVLFFYKTTIKTQLNFGIREPKHQLYGNVDAGKIFNCVSINYLIVNKLTCCRLSFGMIDDKRLNKLQELTNNISKLIEKR